MALEPYHAAGTVSVNNGQTALNFTGAGLQTAGIEAGDYFFANGLMMPLSAVTGQNTATLISGWPGATIAGGGYFIVPGRESVAVALAAREVLAKLTNGNVEALAGLVLAANKAPYATGAGQLALHDQTDLGRAIQGLTGANGGFIRATGAGSAAMQAIVGAVSQSAGVPTGALQESGSNANGRYWRFANGLQIAFLPISNGATINITTALGSIYRSADAESYNWTFPVAFSAVPWVLPVVSEYRSWSGVVSGFASVCLLKGFSGNSLSAVPISALAIGRWF